MRCAVQGKLGRRGYPGANVDWRPVQGSLARALQGRSRVAWPKSGEIAGLRVLFLGGRIFGRAVLLFPECRRLGRARLGTASAGGVTLERLCARPAGSRVGWPAEATL